MEGYGSYLRLLYADKGIEGGLGLRGLIEDFCNHNGGMIRCVGPRKDSDNDEPTGALFKGRRPKIL